MLPNDFTPAHTPIQHFDPNSVIIALHGNTVICDAMGLASAAQLAALAPAHRMLIIGYWQGQAVQFLYWPNGALTLPDTLQALELRTSHALIGDTLWLLASRASQLATFYQTHRFCGVCGAATRQLEHEAACECTACGQRAWPRLSPAVMVLIRRSGVAGEEFLLARSPHFRPGMYSAVAGFVEPGESLEQCAHREVLEEVGVQISNLRWFGSQSWSFPHSLMLAFIADYVAGEIVCQAEEIEDARWFSIDALPELPSTYSLAHRLLDSGIRSGKT